jgi:hypothetical protein
MVRYAGLPCAILTLFGSAYAADARIVCKDGYQQNAGGEVATPYCEDEYLAEVAREYGMKVAASAIRNNPNYKDEVCRLVGHDNRVRIYCNIDQGSSRKH